MVSSAYLRLLIFLLAILIPACASSSPAFLMMYSAYKLNKQGDSIQPWRTHFPLWKQSVVPCPVLTVACWPAYKFLKRQVRWSGIPISFRIFHSLLWSTQFWGQPVIWKGFQWRVWVYLLCGFLHFVEFCEFFHSLTSCLCSPWTSVIPRTNKSPGSAWLCLPCQTGEWAKAGAIYTWTSPHVTPFFPNVKSFSFSGCFWSFHKCLQATVFINTQSLYLWPSGGTV